MNSIFEQQLKPSLVSTVLTDKADYILKSLRDSRNHILALSNEIALDEISANTIRDELNADYSAALIDVSTEINQQTGKLVYPNLDSQKGAVAVALNDDEEYQLKLLKHREALASIQKKKNAIVCLHERRGDLKNEIQLLELLTEAN